MKPPTIPALTLAITANRTAIPFFLGLILGDYTMGSLWAILGPVLGIPTYKIYI